MRVLGPTCCAFVSYRRNFSVPCAALISRLCLCLYRTFASASIRGLFHTCVIASQSNSRARAASTKKWRERMRRWLRSSSIAEIQVCSRRLIGLVSCGGGGSWSLAPEMTST